MIVLLEYIDLFGSAHPIIIAPPSATAMYLMHDCYQVGQYLKHAQKRPKILKLCLRVSYYSFKNV